MSVPREARFLALLAAQPRFNDLCDEAAVAAAQKLLSATQEHLTASSVERVGALDEAETANPNPERANQDDELDLPETLKERAPKAFPANFDEVLKGISTYNTKKQRLHQFREFLCHNARRKLEIEEGITTSESKDADDPETLINARFKGSILGPESHKTIVRRVASEEVIYRTHQFTEEEFLEFRKTFRTYVNFAKAFHLRSQGFLRKLTASADSR